VINKHNAKIDYLGLAEMKILNWDAIIMTLTHLTS